MKTKFFFIFFILSCLSFVNAQKITVATYNIRNDANSDDAKNGNGWQQRLPEVCKLIKNNNFDVFGTQEGLYNQLRDIKEQLPELDYTGVGRDDGRQAGEYSAIFYKRDKFDLLDSGNFWISADSSRPNLGWDAVCVRICSWGKFKEKTSGTIFLFFNLHTDHVGIEARKQGARLVLAKIKEIAGSDPTILTGDFNVDQTNESYNLLNNSEILRDSYELASYRDANNGTFNNFDVSTKNESRIDHIFLTKNFRVTQYKILTNTYWDKDGVQRIPSDHYPVVINVEFIK